MSIDPKVLMPYEKFVQSVLGKCTHGRRDIKGVFKIKDTGEVIEGDNFSCIKTGDAEESYKDAIAYFNHTLQEGESEREFVRAEWEKKQQ